MNETRICGICGKPFVPVYRHPHQKYCNTSACQKERRRRYLLKYNKVWRERHRGYWKKYQEEQVVEKIK
ncbi:MAG: hypothetical protein ACE5GL_03350 [Calditrichia bacterium]